MEPHHYVPQYYDAPPADVADDVVVQNVPAVADVANVMRRNGRRQQYDTHFYCALCGGPFAQVFRTATTPAPTNLGDNLDTTAQREHDPADTDVTDFFNIPEEENYPLPEEYVLGDMPYVAQRSRRSREKEQREGRRKGIMPEPRKVQRAYDGKLICVRQMKWTRSLRALVSHQAREHPAGYEPSEQNVVGDQQPEPASKLCYLTGRGLLRGSYNWADAYADVDHEELVEDENGEAVLPEYPIFTDHDRLNNTFGFHLYKELNGNGEMRSRISSIPFHDECLSILQLAVVETGKELNLEEASRENQNDARLMEGLLEYDALWCYLRSMIPCSGVRQEGMQIAATLQAESRGEVVTRLGELDYREAQSGGEGWSWKHEEGCHWLAADPLMTPLLQAPVLKTLPCTSPHPQPPRFAKVDPFVRLPPEIILEVCHSLSSADIFRWKMASPYVLGVELPEVYYRRFLQEDFKFLHNLSAEIETHLVQQQKYGIENTIDWRGSFERLQHLMRNPRPSGNPEEDAKAWEGIDISLKNRCRIWKIVKPIAEILVSTSPIALLNRHGVVHELQQPGGLVRGLAGRRSSREGTTQVAYFGPKRPGDLVDVTKVEMWTDGATGAFCGMRFYDNQEVLATFGRHRRHSDKIHPVILGIPKLDNAPHVEGTTAQKLAGIGICMADGIICGAQLFVYSVSGPPSAKDRVGLWNGPVRRIVSPFGWREMVGIAGFVNSRGFIETIGILESNCNAEPEEIVGDLPRAMPLTHERASVWNTGIPPPRITMKEREGPSFPEWRTTGADWEIWASQEAGTKYQYVQDGVPRALDLHAMKGELQKIVGYHDKEFLRCLEFHYEPRFGGTSTFPLIRRMGNPEPPAGKVYEKTTYELRGQRILAAVINHSPEGVHGILFVNETDQHSGVMGGIYRGTHKVFGPLPTHMQLRKNSQRTLYREELTNPIIGLHAVYDGQDKRFLQLGLIMPPEDDQYTVFPTSLRQPIPFDVSEDFVVWVTKPTDQELVVGNNRVFSVLRDVDEHPFGLNEARRFTGWAKFSDLKRVTIYGRLKGIKFTYWTEDTPELEFGNTENEHDVLIQEFGREERVVGIAWIPSDDGGDMATAPVQKHEDWYCPSVISRSTHHSTYLDRLHFITNWNQGDISPTDEHFLSKHLGGMKFHFSAYQIVLWSPVYTKENWRALADKESDAERILVEEARYPWKKKPQNIHAEPYLAEPTYKDPIVVSLLPNKDGKIDAVKGYTNFAGVPCGLLLRRNGRWSKTVFGQRSAYEDTFELEQDERIKSILIPYEDSQFKYTAMAFSTNHGRISRWIGRASAQSRAFPDRPHANRELIGLYAVYNDPSSLKYGCVGWHTFGALVYRPEPYSPAVQEEPAGPCPSGNDRDRLDPQTHLPWLTYTIPANITLDPLAIHTRYEFLQKNRAFGRACSHFDPNQLLQIRVWPGQRGIKGIRFRGGPEMGIITVGEWPDGEDRGISSAYKLSIAGPAGERIQRLRLSFQSVEVAIGNEGRTHYEYRLIGLELETNRMIQGQPRRKRIVSPVLAPEIQRDLAGDVIRTLECPEDKVVCGLHGVFSSEFIHDLGFAVVPKYAKRAIDSMSERPAKRICQG